MKLPDKDQTKEVIAGIFNVAQIILVFVLETAMIIYVTKLLYLFVTGQLK